MQHQGQSENAGKNEVHHSLGEIVADRSDHPRSGQKRKEREPEPERRIRGPTPERDHQADRQPRKDQQPDAEPSTQPRA